MTILHHHIHFPSRKPRSRILRLLFLLLLFSFLLIFFSHLPFPPSPSNFCSPSSSPLCCDRSSFRSDICFLNGNIHSLSSPLSFLIFSNSSSEQEERVKPYTRKWESPIMSTIPEIRLNILSGTAPKCDVYHNVTAVVFSTGGYTGNVYHEFNDGLIPLYLTSRRFNRRVVFLVLDYHDWWLSKYGDVVSALSDFPAIDFVADARTHCFPRAVVGLRIHDELAIDENRMKGGETMDDFRLILDEAYAPRIRSIVQERKEGDGEERLKLVVICR